MKKINFVIAFILLIDFTSCRKEDTPKYDLSTFSVILSRIHGWVNYRYNATIDQNGKLNILEESFVFEYYRVSEYQIPTEDILLIKRN